MAHVSGLDTHSGASVDDFRLQRLNLGALERYSDKIRWKPRISKDLSRREGTWLGVIVRLGMLFCVPGSRGVMLNSLVSFS